jgi:hypothetical protein
MFEPEHDYQMMDSITVIPEYGTGIAFSPLGCDGQLYTMAGILFFIA